MAKLKIQQLLLNMILQKSFWYCDFVLGWWFMLCFISNMWVTQDCH